MSENKLRSKVFKDPQGVLKAVPLAQGVSEYSQEKQGKYGFSLEQNGELLPLGYFSFLSEVCYLRHLKTQKDVSAPDYKKYFLGLGTKDESRVALVKESLKEDLDGLDMLYGFVVMQEVKGVSLSQALIKLSRREIILTSDEKISALYLLASQLDYLNEFLGIAHNDIKPEHVVFCPNGDLYLLDWDRSRAVDIDRQQLQTTGEHKEWLETSGIYSFTAPYCQPEKLREGIAKPSDVFPFGVIASMLSKEIPSFQGERFLPSKLRNQVNDLERIMSSRKKYGILDFAKEKKSLINAFGREVGSALSVTIDPAENSRNFGPFIRAARDIDTSSVGATLNRIVNS